MFSLVIWHIGSLRDVTPGVGRIVEDLKAFWPGQSGLQNTACYNLFRLYEVRCNIPLSNLDIL
jgi:hypothetical protein